MTIQTLRRQQGLSIVELLVGITIGLVVAAGGSFLAVNQITEHRRLLTETQLQHDLRAASDMLRLELLRAGYNSPNATNVWAPPSTVGADAHRVMPNRFAPISVRGEGGDNSEISYQYYFDDDQSPAFSNQYVSNVPTNSAFGLRLRNATLQFQLGQNNWQPMTDPEVLAIKNLSIATTRQEIPLSDFCDKPCTADCPVQTLRQVSISALGASKSLPQVARSLKVLERPMTDELSGGC